MRPREKALSIKGAGSHSLSAQAQMYGEDVESTRHVPEDRPRERIDWQPQ